MQDLLTWISNHSIELAGTVAGIAGVWLTTRQLVWCWPVSLINVLSYIYVFYVARLYADFGLQFFYLALTIYGWYNWLYGGEKKTKLAISRMTTVSFARYFVIGTAGFIFLGIMLDRYTDASLPYLDSLVSVWSIICTLLMAQKKLESWIIWVIVDSIYIGINIYKDLHITAVLYLFYTIIAAYGYFNWRRDYLANLKLI